MSINRFPVEPGHILAFARAIGDENPVYVDPLAPDAAALGGVLAPPTFAMASAHFDPDYVLRPRKDRLWFGSASEASGAATTLGEGLHAEQHFEYHRPLVAGDVLIATNREGEVWEKQSRRGGRLRFRELVTEYRTLDADEPTVTARFVIVTPVRG